MLLTPGGTLVSKLNSFKDFPGMHPDVSAPPGKRHQALEKGQTHTEVFRRQLERYFGKE